MEQIAVPIALFLVDKLLSSFDQVSLGNDLRDEVRDVASSLRRMKAYLRDMEGFQGSEVLKVRVQEVRNIAYDTKDIHDEIMLHVTLRSYSNKFSEKAHKLARTFTRWIPLREVSSKMEDIKRRIARVTALDPLVDDVRRFTISAGEGGPSSSSSAAAEHHHLGDDYEIVGFEKQTEELIRQLEGAEETRQKTISLVGPCGSGKSTLTKSVYKITRAQGLFDCYAWVHVSGSPKFEEILISMFKQFCAPRAEPIPHEDKDTKARLRNYLQQKRYLLFLDDIWSINDWEYFQNALPNNGSRGSRIVVTTRNSDVALFCSESSHIHHLEGLSYQEALSLFCKKAFQANKCPQELQEWSDKILIKCESNPQAIVAVGTLLSKKRQIPPEWKRMHDNLVSEIGTDSSLSIINKLLASYKVLPWYLKACFLYFSLFPEHYAVERGTLVRLWIAEGFVMRTPPPAHKTPEEVAEDYLNELVGRSLVHVRRRDFDGRVRDCRVLNFVLEFIIQKSDEENFVSVLSESETSSTSREKIRRLSLNITSITSLRSRDLSSVRSMFYFKAANLSDPSVIVGILRSSKFLSVLDLRDAPLDEFPEDIVDLALLRYLSLRRTNVRNVPKSIKKLSCLETLDLKQTLVTQLPKKINLLQKLRHLLVRRVDVKNYVRFDSVQGVKMVEGIGALTSLQKLSLVKPDKNRKIIKELGALTQLRKLGLIELRKEDGKDLCESIGKMENLSTLDLSSTREDECLDLADLQRPPPHLQRLYLKGHLERFPEWVSSLRSLFRIGLKWSRLESSPLGVLQELPNLTELEMVDAFTGEELEFKAGSFKNLKKLHIEQFNRLHTVVVEELGAMPLLQKLTLCKCVNLKLLPLGINNLTRLEELLLYDMPREFTTRLQMSSEEHEMVSHIHHIRSYILQGNGSWSVDPNLS